MTKITDVYLHSPDIASVCFKDGTWLTFERVYGTNIFLVSDVEFAASRYEQKAVVYLSKIMPRHNHKVVRAW